ncbi:MAG: cell division ATP-binding protein FtsE [Alphaproteobacteria bacterium]
MTTLKKSIIKFHNLEFRYGNSPLILSNVSLDIQKGGFYFLTGKSGAGKTSLLKLMYLGAFPSHGEAHVFGRSVHSYSRDEIALIRQNISVVFQDYKLLPHLTVYDNVALPLRIKGEDEDVIEKKVHQMVKWVGMIDFINTYPDTLSGGQQQRISIARSVITNPKIILADEPTGSVDDLAAKRIISLFEQLHHSGTTVIMATHNQELVNSKKYPELHLSNGSVILKGNE